MFVEEEEIHALLWVCKMYYEGAFHGIVKSRLYEQLSFFFVISESLLPSVREVFLFFAFLLC